jgi:hypothetical protein
MNTCINLYVILYTNHETRYNMQVRSYCRGIAVRAVHPDTRKKLLTRMCCEDMSSLRSFLDKPPTKGKTVKGSGDVGYHLQTRNHSREVISEGTELHRMVNIIYYVYTTTS